MININDKYKELLYDSLLNDSFPVFIKLYYEYQAYFDIEEIERLIFSTTILRKEQAFFINLFNIPFVQQNVNYARFLTKFVRNNSLDNSFYIDYILKHFEPKIIKNKGSFIILIKSLILNNQEKKLIYILKNFEVDKSCYENEIIFQIFAYQKNFNFLKHFINTNKFSDKFIKDLFIVSSQFGHEKILKYFLEDYKIIFNNDKEVENAFNSVFHYHEQKNRLKF